MMNNINLLVSQTKFNFALQFYEQINDFIAFTNSESEVYDFLKLSIDIRELKAFRILDDKSFSDDLKLILRSFSESTTHLNDNMIDSISKSMSSSYCTVIDIESVNEEKFFVFDRFLKKNIEVEHSSLPKDYFKASDMAFVRLVEFDGYVFILSVINTLEKAQETVFVQMVDSFFKENLSIENDNLNIESQKILLLKNNLIDVFFLFSMSLSSFSDYNMEVGTDEQSESVSVMFNVKDQLVLEKFLEYSALKDVIDVEEFFYYVSALYLNQLEPIGETYSTFQNYNFKVIVDRASKDGFVHSKVELYRSIYYLKEYYEYALKFDEVYKKPLIELVDCMDRFFYYENNLSSSTRHFYFDEDLVELIPDDMSIELLDNYNTFLEFFTLHNVKISKGKNTITPYFVGQIAAELNLTPIRDVKVLTQSHYPLIELFFNFSMSTDLIELEQDFSTLDLTDNISNFFSFEVSEQFAIFIHYLFNREFLSTFLSEKKIKDISSIFYNLVKKLEEDNSASLEGLNISHEDFFIFQILERLELINVNKGIIKSTEFGSVVLKHRFKYYNNSKVIEFKKAAE